MEKSEKLKELAAFAEGLGLTAEEVIAYFGKASVQSEEAASVNVVCPGMYYYSDGTISAEVLLEKQISGVVGWVDESGRHGLVLGLREARLPWSTDYLVVNAKAGGRKNTRLILESAQKWNAKAEAAEWCTVYAFDGIQAGGAFLPSRDELVRIFRNFDAIQDALKKINQTRLQMDDWYWSSSKYNNDYAWDIRPSDGILYGYASKNLITRVRCVWKF